MYVLIAVFITTSSINIGAYKGVSYQEFSSKERCEEAAAATRELLLKVRGYPGSDAFALQCVAK